MDIREENDNDDFGAGNDIEEQGEGEDGPNTTKAGIEPRTPATPYHKKPAASNKSSKGKSKRAKSSVSTDNVDYMIASLCKTAMEKNNRQNTELVQKVELAGIVAHPQVVLKYAFHRGFAVFSLDRVATFNDGFQPRLGPIIACKIRILNINQCRVR
jgi:hypothetical protein